MAKPKRSKMKFQKARNIQQSVTDNRNTNASTTGTRVARTVSVGAQTISAEDRYKYIAGDLKTIAIISGALIVFLFILTFFIQ